MFTVDFFKRAVKFSFIGLLALGMSTLTAFEGVHMWVESVELSPTSDEQVRQWGWDQEDEKWTGGAVGGTDPALGFRGRHAVRSAWIAQHWGTGSGWSVVGSRKGEAGALNAVESRLEFAHDFLNAAIAVAVQSGTESGLRPQSLLDLLSRHGNILERIGTKSALFDARSDYERVWAGLPGKGIDVARIGLKLGDINWRLGDNDDALEWWARAIYLTQGGDDSQMSLLPVVPTSAPSAPFAQRTLASLLVSLSAFYSTSGRFTQARSVQESAISLLQTMRHPDSSEPKLAAEELHNLFLQHRSALLSIHLAEVLHALRETETRSLKYLIDAASASERVALALTGLPYIHPDAPASTIPHPPSSSAPLQSAFTISRTIKQPARSLLRDARLTAAEAWNLIGLLSEDTAPEKALECYDRALSWAGGGAGAIDAAGPIGKAGEGVLEADWKAIWANSVRVRDKIRTQERKQTNR